MAMAVTALESWRCGSQPVSCGAASGDHFVAIDIPDGDPQADWFFTPRRAREGVLRCLVLVQKGPEVLEMFAEEGHVFVLAAKRSGKDWLIGHQRGCPDHAVIAKLRAHDKGAFTCGRDCRVGTSPPCGESLLVRHHTMALSKHLPELNAMHVVFPRAEGKPAVAAADAGESIYDIAPGELVPRLRRTLENKSRAPTAISADTTVLQTRKPKWNSRTDSFELPFNGRASLSSERNFQLVAVDGGHDPRNDTKVLLVHGMLSENTYSLDYSHPLSPLHAFAAALTATAW